MHAWCTAAFSSAYGSTATSKVASARALPGVPFARRSCSPISGPRERQDALALRLVRRRAHLRRELLRERGDPAGELRPRLGEHCGLTAVDAHLDVPVHGQLVADLDLQAVLDLARLQTDVRARAVHDVLNPARREREE